MFTEKQHEAVAHIIGVEHKGRVALGEAREEHAIDYVALSLSVMFATDNPDFNSERFMVMCKGEQSGMDWAKAEKYFNDVLDQYKELIGEPSALVTPTLALVFDPILKRFNSGERTPELYEAMFGVE